MRNKIKERIEKGKVARAAGIEALEQGDKEVPKHIKARAEREAQEAEAKKQGHKTE